MVRELEGMQEWGGLAIWVAWSDGNEADIELMEWDLVVKVHG